MAQKKKAPVTPKSAARNAVGKTKSMPLKVGASANKVAKHPLKPKVEPAVKAKVAQPVAAAKVAKKLRPSSQGCAQGRNGAGCEEACCACACSTLAAKAAPALQRTVAVPANAHKAASQKLTAPVAAAQQPVTPKAIAEKAAALVKSSLCRRSR